MCILIHAALIHQEQTNKNIQLKWGVATLAICVMLTLIGKVCNFDLIESDRICVDIKRML